MTLKQFLTHKGKPKFGAASRVAEALKVSLGTVIRWRDGTRTPGIETAIRLQDLYHTRLDLRPKKRRKANVAKILTPVSSR